VDIVQVTARQVPIITVATDFQDGKYNFIDREPLFSVSVAMVESGTLRGNFIVDSQITIFELKNNLLERLTAQPGTDYMFGTLQGPLYDSNWLSEYMAHVLYVVSAQIAARLRRRDKDSCQRRSPLDAATSRVTLFTVTSNCHTYTISPAHSTLK